MSTFSERLAELISARIDEKRSNTAFSRLVGLSEGAIRSYLAGSLPKVDALVKITKATGVSINWLATGEGPRDSSTAVLQMGGGTQPEHPEAPVLQAIDQSASGTIGLVMVPQLDVQAAAGSGRSPTDEAQLGLVAFGEAYLRHLGINPRSAHIIQVSGHSMAPTLQNEDLVLVDTSIDHVRDEALYAVVFGGLVLIKRVRILPDGSIMLSSDNKLEGSDTTIRKSDLGDLVIAGRVCGRVSRM